MDISSESNTRNSEPVVYINGTNLIIPTETLEYIGIDKSSNSNTYTIDAVLESGEKITKSITVNIIDTNVSDDMINTENGSNSDLPQTGGNSFMTLVGLITSACGIALTKKKNK